ncbi:hypothetical protein VA7868_01561 [Vibrio aerogenes CECT 7868]|uniref:N-acetyltransferase domain-containing protein n=1 Tax=Vibrio aerogenes CECT 7868 TaxID=1216006 RepID=A0A1M5Y9R0_9VIBR|nr:N-acetyltransferase [Vibrio aerogenes]SHI08696.1 hypothetical protein VA7868_01561 [Vibrio aerogenes CECT 7868]
MLIRTEAPADILPIDRLLRSLPGKAQDADIVSAAREQGLITLSLVACQDDGEIIGYALFTPLQENGHYQNWQYLALLVVHPEFVQAEKILIEDGLNMLLELGYPACTAYGDSELYRTFGFVPASHFDLNTSGSIEPDNLLIFELAEGVAQQSDELIEMQNPVTLRHILN